MFVKVGVVVAAGILLSACQTVPEKMPVQEIVKVESPIIYKKQDVPVKKQGFEAFLEEAENQATPEGRAVLKTGRSMVLQEKSVIRGSCWDYANAIYNRAGFHNPKTDRQVVFTGSNHGPFARPEWIKPGDFLSHVNHSHHESVHSAIFVGWHDFAQQQAIMLSYAGERKAQPARYKVYDLSNVYQIVRPKDTQS